MVWRSKGEGIKHKTPGPGATITDKNQRNYSNRDRV